MILFELASWDVGGSLHAVAGVISALSIRPLAIGWDWWLPPNYSVHGRAIDQLFIAIFWLTMFIFVGCEAVLIWFMWKYRHRAGCGKGIFSHGNTKLEMIWTIIPAIILIFLSLITKGVWDNYRYAPGIDHQKAPKILVIGQQYKWNVVYPGPDGKMGRYLIFPKPTDLKWPAVPEGASFDFPPVPGPAYMKEVDALVVLDKYIDEINPLGKDFSDPAGLDDDWKGSLNHPLEIPKGIPVEISIGSKDVIHDFYLPNFRVRLDAVPGMRGVIYLTATTSSSELEKQTRREYSVDELQSILVKDPKKEMRIAIDATSPNAVQDSSGIRYKQPGKHGATIIRDGAIINIDPDPDDEKQRTVFQELKDISVDKVVAYEPKNWDLVCAELCGVGHSEMKGTVIVLEADEYQKKYGPHPATAATPTPDTLAKNDAEHNAEQATQ